MLAKENKIRTLEKQKKFIEDKLDSSASSSPNGDVSYRYVGNVYPEVLEYLQQLGYDALLSRNDDGIPVYVFIISRNLLLTPAELEESKSYLDLPSNIIL